MIITTHLHTLVTLGEGITKIAITGGPCSGKTTGLAKLVQMLQDKGYKVLVSPESAAKLIGAGAHPWELPGTVFQRQILLDTLMQEERMAEAAIAYRDQGFKVVILCDRGAMDGQAYVSEGEFEPIVTSLGLTLHDICNARYHAVIHLRTAALGAENFYTLANNTARKEPAEEARILDQKTLEAWIVHHHPRVIDNSTGFDEKIERLLTEVCEILGDPVPIEREEKFLLEAFDPAAIPALVSTSRICQDYLFSADPEEERRVRSRSDQSGTSYFYTVKRAISAGRRYEVERMISLREYEEHLASKDPSLQRIWKSRHCFFHENQFIEVDQFDAPDQHRGLTVMEIEMSEREEKLIVPDFLKVSRCVTGDKKYSNRSLAEVA